MCIFFDCINGNFLNDSFWDVFLECGFSCFCLGCTGVVDTAIWLWLNS